MFRHQAILQIINQVHIVGCSGMSKLLKLLHINALIKHAVIVECFPGNKHLGFAIYEEGDICNRITA